MKDLLDPQVLFLIGTLAFAAWVMVRWPDFGVVLGSIVFYLNLPALATKLHGVPGPIAGASILVFAPALIDRMISRRPRFVIDLPLLLMFLFLATLLISSLWAIDEPAAWNWVVTFVLEGIIFYLIIVNVVRSASTLRRVSWALLFSGTLLASMTLYQEVTKDYKQEFGGLAQRMLELETASLAAKDQMYQGPRQKIRTAHRAQGPIDDPNRYSQMLLVVLPLAWVLVRRSPHVMARWLAAGSAGVLVAAILLTYSRGAFITLVVMAGLAAALRAVRLKFLLPGVVLFAVVATVVAPGYTERILSLRGLQGMVAESNDYGPDSVQRGRATEMLAAWYVFLDHPVMGVGPGQFSKAYSLEYMNREFSLRRIVETRRAHSLLLEMLAEAGAIGTGIYLAIMLILVQRLLQLWQLRRVSDPEAADYGLAFMLSIVAYQVTGLFLHLAYMRYYWFLIALASAAVHIALSGGFRRAGQPLVVLDRSPEAMPAVAASRR